MTIVADPYEFSLTDARKTLHHATHLLDMYPVDVHPHQAARRHRIAAVLDELDASSASAEHVEAAFRAVWPELRAARDDLVASARLPEPQVGWVERVSASDGGVPKRAIESAEVGFGGVVGDRQRSRQHHGRPWQALCVWSSEVIASFAAQGHPIFPGAAGENVTVAGLDWPAVHPGVRLQLGSTLCEVSAYAVPCFNLKPFFADADFERLHYSNGPVSRVYATVLEPGTITVGDPAVLEP